MIDVVRNEGGGRLLAWRYPCQELAAWTQLIVDRGEEALLLTGGRPAERFTAGRYTLKTANLPLLGRLLRLPFGGKSPFPAELWFVTTGLPLDIKWGTDSPIYLQGSGCEAVATLRGYGLFGVCIIDAERFLSALRGRVATFDSRGLAGYLREQLAPVVRATIQDCYSQLGAGFFEKSGTSQLLSQQLQLRAAPLLAEYGLGLHHLTVSDLCGCGQAGEEQHLTFSILSVVMPPAADAQPKGCPPQREQLCRGVAAASFLLLLLLVVVLGLLLPPRQTADFAGIALVTLAHLLTTGVLLRLFSRPRCLLLRLGCTVTAGLYWLGAVGVALFFRLLSLPGSGGLLALELGWTVAAALALLGFWLGRGYDALDIREEREAADEAEATE